MFKNKNYSKNKNIIIIPKHIDKHDIKNVDIKPNNNNKNYENIRNIVENNEQESISKPDLKQNIKNKFNIV